MYIEKSYYVVDKMVFTLFTLSFYFLYFFFRLEWN